MEPPPPFKSSSLNRDVSPLLEIGKNNEKFALIIKSNLILEYS